MNVASISAPFHQIAPNHNCPIQPNPGGNDGVVPPWLRCSDPIHRVNDELNSAKLSASLLD